MDDGLHPNPDGTITAVLEGEPHRLRRPKAGEFFDFHEQIQDFNDETRREAQAIVADMKAATDADDDEAKAAVRKREREFRVNQDTGRIAWMRNVFGALSDRALPEDDRELPVWLFQDAATIEMVRHWREVPIHRGGE